ncbi:hypothetical protein WR25_08363 [Diploscapter pachys]|uniref:Uncharacterized protein n=1 Tax=Diploscapter pachys TaxID=2018661 RepID=A0A2A2M2P3_9BILA|nr:hypothetical protein WR25_08363 [Diploscapter pachys]
MFAQYIVERLGHQRLEAAPLAPRQRVHREGHFEAEETGDLFAALTARWRCRLRRRDLDRRCGKSLGRRRGSTAQVGEAGFVFHDGAPFPAGVAIGGAIGDLDGTGRGAEAFDQFAGLFIDAWGVGVAGGEDDIGRFLEQLDELRGRLDRGEVEGARAAWDQHQVGDLDRGAGGAVGMGRRVDDDELGTLALGCGDLGGEARGWAVDHLGRRIAAPGGPLARGRLRVGIDDERDAPRILGGRGEVDGERRLPRPPLLADDRNDWHERHPTCRHGDVASGRHVGQGAFAT